MIRELECSGTLFWLFAESLEFVYWFWKIQFRRDDEEERDVSATQYDNIKRIGGFF